MNKLAKIILGLVLILLLGMSLVSASLCKNHKGYYDDCKDADLKSKKSYGNYKVFNEADPDKPIFKGSYGNYRYRQYSSGDISISRSLYGDIVKPRGSSYRSSSYRSSGSYFMGSGYGYRSYGYGSGYYSPSFISWFW
jgi:hypothetical protein